MHQREVVVCSHKKARGSQRHTPSCGIPTIFKKDTQPNQAISVTKYFSADMTTDKVFIIRLVLGLVLS